MAQTDTIFALSSGQPPAGLAVIRLSGPLSSKVLEKLCGSLTPHRQAGLRLIHDLEDGEIIDQALTLWFPGPNSFTGEDCVEFHCHGGRAVIEKMLSVLSNINGCRLAEPGEFTQRAFGNGKIDLLEVEGLSDLISADTESQRKLAFNHFSGKVSSRFSDWRERLIRVRAFIEAELDFADEEDVPGSISDQVWLTVQTLIAEMEKGIESSRRGEQIRRGYSIVLVGPPNSGKSSLLNCLAQRDVAIVTPIAGTTRDSIDVLLDLEGYSVRVTDTAGLRETDDEIEKIGIGRTIDKIEEADLLIVFNSDGPKTDYESAGNTINIWNKSDLLEDDEKDTIRARYDVLVSARSEEGISDLINLIKKCASEGFSDTEDILVTRQRHLGLLREGISSLRQSLDESKDIELRSEDLRLASQALGRIIGTIDIEDMYDKIFREFCIGK